MDAFANTVVETQPLLQNETAKPVASPNVANVVDFDPEGDAENPMDWPVPYKWGIVVLLATTAFTVTFTCASVIPVASSIIEDLEGKQASKSANVLLVTIWELGEAAGPLFIAPLSEVFGRYPVMNAANFLFIAATLLASFSPTAPLMIFARFLNGLGVASNVLSPAIVGDIFVSEKRGTAMSMIMLFPLVGGAIGPAIGGAIAQSIGWRPVLWISAGLAAVCEILFLTCFRETFKVPILNRRAARLRRETGNLDLKTVFEGNQDAGKVWESIMRPMIVFIDSSVLQAMSLFGSVAFSYFYVMSTSFPDILQSIYRLTPTETGLAFLSFSIGSFISVFACNRFLDGIYIKLRDAHKGIGQPEFRLPLVILGGFSLPVVVLLYGWVAETRLSIVFMLLTNVLFGIALMWSFLPLMSYVVDAFGLYSASAMTAVIVTRCLMGTFLPLAAEVLVESLGYGLAFTVLGALSLSLAPIPVIVMRYGERWRQHSNYTRQE